MSLCEISQYLEKAPTRTFSLLKVSTTTKNLLRHYTVLNGQLNIESRHEIGTLVLKERTVGLFREGSLTALVVTGGWILTVSAQLADGAGPQQARDQDRQPEGVPRQETVAEVRPGHQVSWGYFMVHGSWTFLTCRALKRLKNLSASSSLENSPEASPATSAAASPAASPLASPSTSKVSSPVLGRRAMAPLAEALVTSAKLNLLEEKLKQELDAGRAIL